MLVQRANRWIMFARARVQDRLNAEAAVSFIGVIVLALLLLFLDRLIDFFEVSTSDQAITISLIWSAIVVFVLMLMWPTDPTAKCRNACERMSRSRSITASKESLEAFLVDLLERAERLSKYFSLGSLALVMLSAASLLAIKGIWPGFLETITVLVVAAVTWRTGRFGGRLLAQAGLLSLMGSHEIALRTIPGHPDRTGGTKPLGDIWLSEVAAIFGPPALGLFLFWYIAVRQDSTPNPLNLPPGTIEVLLVSLIVLLLTSLVVLAVLVVSFHPEMKRQAEGHRAFAMEHIQRLFEDNGDGRGVGQNETVDVELQELLLAFHWESENVTSWPLNWRSFVRLLGELMTLPSLVGFVSLFGTGF